MSVVHAKDNLCSFKAIRKVHEVNQHKGKEQLLSAYRNAGLMSPDLINMINCVVNDCRVCQKLQKSVVRPRVSLLKARSFNEIVTLDLKEFGNKYILWMIESFMRFIQGKLLNIKKADTIIQALTDTLCMNVCFPSH